MTRQLPSNRNTLTRPIAFVLSVLLVLAAGTAGASSPAGNAPLTSSDRLRHFMEQVRPQPSGSQAGGQAVREAVAVSPARLKERADLLKTGEAALAGLNVASALDAFERAALILHAADTEIALVRGHMQAGDYRRALAFGAHTAGAHLDVMGGSLLYAWLLHAGGQPAIAQRLLAAADARMPGNAGVAAVQQQIDSGTPVASGQLLNLPARLAPYGSMKGLPRTARVVGSAVLLPGGSQALVPLGLLPASGRLWLRNGLGQLVRASVDQRWSVSSLARVRLERPLPVAETMRLAASDAFPGSPGFAVEYARTPNATPAWPILRSGFLGAVQGDSGQRLLGIDMPAGARGGPVFDGAGQLIGMALPASGQGSGKGGDRLVPVSELKKILADTSAVQPPGPQPVLPGVLPRSSADAIYESSLKTSLQVITAP